ncbi:MAG: response regulator transcription factor [Actinobacteria bacterium]|nr:response regulator transcription factor [Actinomycetota bacterium]
MPDILVATDAQWILDEITSVLSGGDTTVRGVNRGAEVTPAVEDYVPDLVILDLQIGNMGGMAAAMDLRLEESAGRLPRVRILMLLDRRPDVFLARRSDVDGWLVKPVSPIKLRKAVGELLAGKPYRDTALTPDPVLVAPPAE